MPILTMPEPNVKKDVTKVETMIELQGDRVLLATGKAKDGLILTIVHVVDVNKRELLLVNREEKSRETWAFTQELMDRLVPIKGNPHAKWKLVL